MMSVALGVLVSLSLLVIIVSTTNIHSRSVRSFTQMIEVENCTYQLSITRASDTSANGYSSTVFVFLGGIPESSLQFRSLQILLSQIHNYATVVIEPLGFGTSNLLSCVFGGEEQRNSLMQFNQSARTIDTVAAMLEHNGVKQVLVVSADLSGIGAWYYGCRYAESSNMQRSGRAASRALVSLQSPHPQVLRFLLENESAQQMLMKQYLSKILHGNVSDVILTLTRNNFEQMFSVFLPNAKFLTNKYVGHVASFTNSRTIIGISIVECGANKQFGQS